MSTALPELNRKAEIPAIVPVRYLRDASSIEYSDRLVRTHNKSYYENRSDLSGKDYRMSAQCEELAIQLALEKVGQDPRKAEVFNDLFARNDDKRYVWQWTRTGLRVPKGWEGGKIDNGVQKYPRILLDDDQEIVDVMIPVGNGRVVIIWNEATGMPEETADVSWPHEGYTTHFWFNSNPDKDKESGKYDVAVRRWSDWHDDVHGCLYVSADYLRVYAFSGDGFRPVRGQLPKITKG
ncbi:MAG: hypothetical protein ABIA21_01010 [Candidatus Aenigmatarchaeota archaeon]